jgi:two-component system, response regulator, stage 0 sporulation protein F
MSALMAAPKILIVDDDSDLRAALTEILIPVAEVIQASNGIEALDLIRTEQPRLALLDVAMPGADGLQVLESARALHPSIIVIMLTTRGDVETARKALGLGASEYVTKPFDASYIRSEVARLLRPPPAAVEEKPWKLET